MSHSDPRERRGAIGILEPKGRTMSMYDRTSAHVHAMRMAAMTAVPPVEGEGKGSGTSRAADCSETLLASGVFW